MFTTPSVFAAPPVPSLWGKITTAWTLTTRSVSNNFQMSDFNNLRFTACLTTAPWWPLSAPDVVTSFSLWRTRASWSGYRWCRDDTPNTPHTGRHVCTHAFNFKAINQTFHADCFACDVCGCRLSDDPGERCRY